MPTSVYAMQNLNLRFRLVTRSMFDQSPTSLFPYLFGTQIKRTSVCRIAELLIGSVAIGSDQFVKRCSGQTNIKFSPFKMSSRVPTGPRLFSPSVAVRAAHLGTGRHRNDSTGSNADDNHLVLGSGREGPS